MLVPCQFSYIRGMIKIMALALFSLKYNLYHHFTLSCALFKVQTLRQNTYFEVFIPLLKMFLYSRRVVRLSVCPEFVCNLDLAENSCPTHNVVICSRILKLFHINNHHIETTCRAQHLGR